MDRCFAAALASEPPAVTTLAAWRAATAAARAVGATPIARAFLGGAAADRLGFAFAGGYAEALRALVPGPPRPLLALCATEEGGAHPRAIRTALTADGDGHRLSGHKRWATLSDVGGDLLVIATRGAGADGKPRLAAVAIPDDAPGVTLTASAAPFVPEIPHATVALVDVAVVVGAGIVYVLPPTTNCVTRRVSELASVSLASRLPLVVASSSSVAESLPATGALFGTISLFSAASTGSLLVP